MTFLNNLSNNFAPPREKYAKKILYEKHTIWINHIRWKFFMKLINVWHGIRACWVENFGKINKRTPTLIGYSRVLFCFTFQNEFAKTPKSFVVGFFNFLLSKVTKKACEKFERINILLSYFPLGPLILIA